MSRASCAYCTWSNRNWRSHRTKASTGRRKASRAPLHSIGLRRNRETHDDGIGGLIQYPSGARTTLARGRRPLPFPLFIDESCAKTNMTRLHGWTPRSERLVDKVPPGHRATATFLAAPRREGIDALPVRRSDQRRSFPVDGLKSKKILTAFTPDECADCLVNAGYAYR